MLHGGFWSAGLAGGGTRASKERSGTSFVGSLAEEVGVVAEAGCDVVADSAEGKLPDAEPDDRGGPLRLLELEGMAKGANEPLD